MRRVYLNRPELNLGSCFSGLESSRLQSRRRRRRYQPQPSTEEPAMSDLSAYLIFNGNCAEAMRFYERTLGGKLELMMTARESPASDHVPAEALDQIMHARLAFDDGRYLMA